MVPTSHLSTISFYFISRSTDVWVSTYLASLILLAISVLFFHREPSAGTHGIFVFVFIGTKCWNPQHYCLCFHIGNQVLEPTALLSLLSYREPSAGTHSVIIFAFISGTKCWNPRLIVVALVPRSRATARGGARYQYIGLLGIRVVSNQTLSGLATFLLW